MAFDVEGALKEGYTQEQIDAYIQQNNITVEPIEVTPKPIEVTPEPIEEVTEEIITAPTPQPSPEPIQKTFDVEGALKEGYTQEQIDTYLKRKKTFDLEGALKEGYTQEQISAYLLKEKEYAGFFESISGSLGNQLDVADVGLSTLLPGGEDANKAADRFIKEQESKPQSTRFSYADIEDAFDRGGVEGLKELVLQLPGGLGEAIAAIGPSVAAGATGFAIAGPVGAILALAAISVAPNLGGNVVEQATADLEAGRPLDVDTATAIVATVPQVALDILPFKFSALKKLVGLDQKTGGALRKQIAEQGLTKAIGKDVASVIAAEMPAEVVQEIITKVQAGKDAFSEEAFSEYKQTAAIVFLTGGVGAYTGPRSRSKARKEIQLEEEANLQKKLEPEVDDNKNPRQQAINNILNDEKNIIKAEEEQKSARKISRTKLTVINEEMIKDLGINPKSNAGKELLGKDLTDLDNMEMIDNLLSNENLQVKRNQKAVDNFKRKIKRDRKTILKAQKEAQDAKPAIEGQGTGAGNTILDKSKPPVTESAEALDTGSMDVDQSGIGGNLDTAGTVDNPLIDNAKNPILKNPKVGTKARIGRVVGDKVEVLKGVIEDGPNGLELVSKEGKGTIRTPLNNEQVLNPTKKDITQLETLAPRIKENKAKVKSKKQQLLESKKEENKKDIDTKEKELNEAGFESYEEFDQDGNSIKGVRKIREKKPSKRPGKFIGKKIIEGLKEAKTLGQVFNKLGTVFKERLTKPQASLLQKLRALPNIKKTKFNVTPGLEAVGDVAEYGSYTTITDSVAVSDNADAETVLHESTHAATALWVRQNVKKGKGVTALGRRMVNLYEQAKQASRDSGFAFDNELATMDEFITEAFNNQEFQKFLAETPSTESTPTTISSLWTDFVEVVTEALGLSNIENTLLNDVISLAPELFKGPNAEVQAQGPNTVLPKKKKSRNQLMQEIENVKTPKEKLNDRRKKAKKTTDDPADPFYKSNKTIGEKARGFQNAVFGYDIGLYNRLKDEIIKVSKSPSVRESKKFIEDTLAKISIAQAVHAQTLAGAFKELGNMIYNPVIEKFEVIKDAYNLRNIENMVRSFAKNNFKKGLILKQSDITAAEKYISQAITAKQFKAIIENNKDIEAEGRRLVRQGKNEKAKEVMKGYVLVDQTEAQIDTMIKRFDDYPEIAEIQQSWIGVKNNVLQFLLDTEVIDQEQFDEYTLVGGASKDSLDKLREDVFVPLYREGQTNVPRPVKKGTKSGRGIFVPRKGSIEPVDNVFLNMDIFVQAGITQGIANKTALNKIRTAIEVQTDENLIVRPTAERTRGFEDNAVEVSEIGPDGKQRKQLYEYSNIMYAKATNGAAKAMEAGNVFLANASTLLRDQIVLNPVFGVAQTFIQDMYSAMYTSGLRYGWLMIPLRVMYEFPMTILNLSSTHKKISKYGAVGGYAFKQNDNSIDADINAPGFYNGLIRRLSRIPGTNIPSGITQEGALRIGNTKLSIGGLLNRIAMASDNSVRQAVYQQALMENKSQRRALEMAFEIINFRKTGDHQLITAARQYIPFFGAALQALSVQGKVIQGLVKPQSGVTPTDLREARINFLVTWAGTAGMTLLYNILMDDEEDKIIDSFSDYVPMSEELKEYLKEARRNFNQLDNKIRDRRFIIGDDGFHLTLRPDLFTYISKIIPEQSYQTIIAENQDAAKFWSSIKRNLKEIVSLNLIPQAIRPLVDLYYNEDNRTGRPIVPDRMQDLEPEMQYNSNTSEAAKKIAEITGFSPIQVDYFFRQYTGYTGGLVSMITDAYFLEADTNPNRKNKPAVTTRDKIASFPGMTNFYTRDKDNRFMSNFYELKNKASQVGAIFRALDKSPNPEDQLKAQSYLNEGNNRLIYNTNVEIEQIQLVLSEIRKGRQNIYDQPANGIYNGRRMTDEFKRLLLKDLDKQEVEALQTVHDLRVKIYGVNPFYNSKTDEYFPGFNSTDFFGKGN